MNNLPPVDLLLIKIVKPHEQGGIMRGD